MNVDLLDLFLVSGSVSHKGAMMGKEMRYTRIAFQPAKKGGKIQKFEPTFGGKFKPLSFGIGW